MQIQLNQGNHHFNSRFVSSSHKANADTSLKTRRRMLETQDKEKEAAAVKVTISAEAMALSQKAKEMERAQQQLPNPVKTEEMDNTENAEKTSESEETVQLTDKEIYDELVDQMRIWGDEAANIRNKFGHKETKEMAEKRAAALTELQNLEELQKSAAGKLEKDAQKAAAAASQQQEEINKKNSELIMMLESFEEQEEGEDGGVQAEDNKDNASQKDTDSTGSLMEGNIGASAAKRELGMLGSIEQMEQSGAYGIANNNQSVRGLLDERKNIYKMNNDSGISIKEKIAAMSDYVGTLVNPEMMEDFFKKRIDGESDEDAKKKLESMKDYFMDLDMKNALHSLTEERAYAIQEKINARDLRIAHLGDRHLAMAEQQKKELQSLFDEDDIMRTQGQGGITSRTEDVAERLQEKLHERDYIDEDTTPEEDVREKEELEEKELEKEQHEEKELAKAESGQTLIKGSLNSTNITEENK